MVYNVDLKCIFFEVDTHCIAHPLQKKDSDILLFIVNQFNVIFMNGN